MKKQLLYLSPMGAAMVIMLSSSSCSKNNVVTESPKTEIADHFYSAGVAAKTFSLTAEGDTLLNVNYESGTESSGITGLDGSDAAAPDAAYMVSPGASGGYAIAHKVVDGDSTYFSDGKWRSESSGLNVSAARFIPGDERRYEFSVLIKDWPAWNAATTAPSGPNLFQLRVTGDNTVPVMIRSQRNNIGLRKVDGSIATLVTNYPNYVNQWIQIRVDVLWKKDATGYINTYVKLPGASAYSLISQQTNVITYTGDGPGGASGQFGYPKWGVYGGVPAGETRIAYHDDIRVIALN